MDIINFQPRKLSLNEMYDSLFKYAAGNKVSLYYFGLDNNLENQILDMFSYSDRSFILCSILMYYKDIIDLEVEKRRKKRITKTIGSLLIAGVLLFICIKYRILLQ